MKRPLLFLTLIIGLDQLSKYVIRSHFLLGESHPLAPFFRLTYTTNSGVAFSMLQGKNTLFAIFSSLILAGLTYWFIKNGAMLNAALQWALLLIGAGAAGNLIDRFVFGHVIDFFDAGIGIYRWPVFNIADSCITIGGGILLFYLMLHPKSQELN